MRGQDLIAVTIGAGLALGTAVACADPLPRPSVDYRAEAKAARGVDMKVAHRAGRLRMDITSADLAGTTTSFIDLGRRRMTLLMALPGVDRTAIDMELPVDYVFAEFGGEGTRIGADVVAGEACDLWRSASKVADAPVESCITGDGIVLKTSTTIEGNPVVIYEVTELERGPQDPAQFDLPKGVKVTKVPSGLGGLLQGLTR